MHLANPPVGISPDCGRLGNLSAAAKETLGAEVALAESDRQRLEAVASAGKDFAYQYTYTPNERLPNQHGSRPGLYRHYEMRADPMERDTTGFSSFWMSDTVPFRYNDRRAAGPSDPAWPPDDP